MAKIVDVEEKRADIIAAAWRVGSEQGLEVATMRTIAAEAGYTTGMVTHYFANKNEILEALVEEVARRAEQRLIAAQKSQPGLAGLRSLLYNSLPLDRARAGEWRIFLALWNRSVTGGELTLAWSRRERAWMSLLREAINDAIDFGDLPPDAARDDEVETLSALIYGLSVRALMSADKLGPRKLGATIDEYIARRWGVALRGPAYQQEEDNGAVEESGGRLA